MLPGGILPPVTTPFSGDAFDRAAFVANLERWNATGLAGYVVAGSNGEGVSLDEDEFAAVLEAAMEARGAGKVVVAGTGRETTRDAIDATRRAARAGVDAALVFSPSYFKGAMTEAVIEAHYRAVADATEIPIILYHVPKFRPVTFSAELICRLAGHPNILGIKETSGDIVLMASILHDAPPGFRVYVGTASMLLAGLALGAHGGILALANVAPSDCLALYSAVEHGDLQAARELQYRLLAVNRAVTTRFGIAGLKHALDLLGYHGGEPRRPLQPLDAEGREEIRRVLGAAALL